MEGANRKRASVDLGLAPHDSFGDLWSVLALRITAPVRSPKSILEGCTALITGASSGLGSEFARQLAPQARCLVLVARREDRLESIAAEIGRPGLVVHKVAADLGSEADVARLLRELDGRDLKIDLLVNNAGVGDHGLFENGDWQRVKAMLDVNIRGLTQITHGLLPGMVARRHGGILNVSSITSLLPLPQMAVYAASKAYVTSLSEALRAELRGTGVSVTALCPGPIDTEFATVADRAGSTSAQLAPDIFKIPPQQAVAEGLRALDGDRARVIPGWIVLLTMALTALVPLFVLRHFLNRRGRQYSGH
jgi:short-subunit dehydrogenase